MLSKLLNFALLTESATEGTEVVEKLKGWDKLVDWAGSNFNATVIVVGGGILTAFLINFGIKLFKKNYVARDRVARYKNRR